MSGDSVEPRLLGCVETVDTFKDEVVTLTSSLSFISFTVVAVSVSSIFDEGLLLVDGIADVLELMLNPVVGTEDAPTVVKLTAKVVEGSTAKKSKCFEKIHINF